MTFAQSTGYTPRSVESLMELIREGINTQMTTTFTTEQFQGTNYYKILYPLVQKVASNETKAAEIFQQIENYILTTNLRIQRPSVSLPGLIESFETLGYVANPKETAEVDAGTMSVCVDVDDTDPDYADMRLEICENLKNFVAGGMVFLGTEEETLTLTNGQQFTFKYFLPDKTDVILKLTITPSDNNPIAIPSDEEIRQVVFDNISERYRLGWDFAPQRYYTQEDAPWAATIVLEWSSNDGADWNDTVFEAAFDDLFVFGLEDISVVIS